VYLCILIYNISYIASDEVNRELELESVGIIELVLVTVNESWIYSLQASVTATTIMILS
jgi:hypothetical protein